MALKPLSFKIEEEEIDAIGKEALQRPDKSRSAYLRDIVLKRPKPQKKAKAK